MTNLISMTQKALKTKTLAVIITITAAVALPQLFHVIGIASGTGTVPGEIFLPMHLPIIISGMLAGPVAGLIAGALSPILSFSLTGMPTAVMLPFMIIELAAYGLCAGFLRNVKMPSVLKLVAVQLAGRVLRAVAILFAVYALGSSKIGIPVIYNSILKGLPGLILQWSLIPLFVFWVKNHDNETV